MGWNWAKDAAERVVRTFLQAFLAQITASGLGLIDLVEDTDTVERAALAGLAAVYSLVFAFLSGFANQTNSAPAGVVSIRE